MSIGGMIYFVTAIGTDCGKTLVSAILCEALKADYWKPVQAGLPRDADTVRGLVTNRQTVIHPETYLLKTPASPHAAARIDSVNIKLNSFKLPPTNRTLVIEGAGGCLVPLNDQDFVVDLIAQTGGQVVVVSNYYLGSINHTLLTAALLREKNIPVAGIIFNGKENVASREIILRHTRYKVLLEIDQESKVDAATVTKYANRLTL